MKFLCGYTQVVGIKSLKKFKLIFKYFLTIKQEKFKDNKFNLKALKNPP